LTCACTAYSLLELSYQVERRVCDKLRGTLNFQHYARAHCCLWYAIRDICSCIYAPEDITASIGISWKHLPRKNTPVVPGYITQLSNTLEYSSPSLPASKRKIPTSWFDHNITSTSASTTGRKHSLEKPYQQSVHFISLHSQFGLIPVVFIKKPRSIQELWTSDPFSSVFWQLRWLCRRWRHLGRRAFTRYTMSDIEAIPVKLSIILFIKHTPVKSSAATGGILQHVVFSQVWWRMLYDSFSVWNLNYNIMRSTIDFPAHLAGSCLKVLSVIHPWVRLNE